MTLSKQASDAKLIKLLQEKACLREHSDATAYARSSELDDPSKSIDGEHSSALLPGGEPTRGEQDQPNDPSLSRLLWTNYSPDGEKLSSLDFGITDVKATSGSIEFRVQASKCYRGEAWSFSVRRNGTAESSAAYDLKEWIEHLERQFPQPDKFPLRGYRPSQYHEWAEDKVSLASHREISRSLLRLLGAEGSPLAGFIFITGETKCGKSNIARGMIYEYLLERKTKKKDRNLHLVTFEDPIEEWLYSIESLTLKDDFRKDRRIDYTPRQKGLDCKSLKESTRSALRQTPTVFFAGELREASDLAEAVAFGGTGHLIVATGHAGSLVESAEKILSALKITTSGQRAVSVPKILGIIHLRPHKLNFKVNDISLEASMTVPSVYRRCQSGVQSFVADGLASLLPYCPTGVGTDQAECYGSLGRQFMVSHILRESGAASSFLINPDILTESKQVSLKRHVFQGNWRQIRDFHAGPFSQIGTRDKAGRVTTADKELWVTCAEDDVNGVG